MILSYTEQQEIHLEAIRGGWICTLEGHKFFPLEPDPSLFSILECVSVLSKKCRYGCHVDRFYSVAEHSVLVSQLVEERAQKHGKEVAIALAKWGLAHDLVETWLPDVPYPLKQRPEFSFFRELEASYFPLIAAWLGLDGEEEPALVRQIDLEIVAHEVFAIKAKRHKDWILPAFPEPLIVKRVKGLKPKKAAALMLARFVELWPNWVF